ncbi:UNVERIFIED_CONTAM: hypothetical protein K2H54_001764, partial [Gekko kuhli]
KVSSFDLTQGFPIYSNNVYNEEAGFDVNSSTSANTSISIGISCGKIDYEAIGTNCAVVCIDPFRKEKEGHGRERA